MLPERSDGFDGERLRLSRVIRWQIEPKGDAPAAPSPAQLAGGSGTRQFAARAEAAAIFKVRYLSAAVRAWNTPQQEVESAPEAISLDLAESTAVPAPDVRWLVWLHPGELPAGILAWVRSGGSVLLEARTPGASATRAPIALDAHGAVLLWAQRLGAGRVLQLAGELTPAAVPMLLEPDFPVQLRGWFDAPADAPSLAQSLLQVPRSDLPAWPQPALPLQAWLAWLLLGVFALERWLASAPGRQADR